jgi:TPR repeat protein
MFYKGEGITQNYTISHMWFNLAAANGVKEASKYRDIVAINMTSSQIAEAQKLAKEWVAKHQSN